MTTRTTTDVPVPWRVAALVTAALVLLFTLQNTVAPPAIRSGQPMARVFALQLVVWGVWLALTPLIFRIASRGRAAVGAAGRLTVGIVVAQTAAGFAVALVHGVLHGSLRSVLGLSVSPDHSYVLAAIVTSSFAGNVLRFWMIAACYHAVAYHLEVRERDARAARLAARLTEARLEALERRLHPHFLFNTLNTITAYVRDDPRAAERMIAGLSELVRAALHTEPGRVAPLTQELDLLRRYVDIESARFSDRLQVRVAADQDSLNALVPYLLLQPLVENAIRHGIAARERGGTVSVRASRRADALDLVVEDDGVGIGGMPAPGSGAGLGVASTRERLEQLYGHDFVFDIGDAPTGGTLVRITLPFRTARGHP